MPSRFSFGIQFAAGMFALLLSGFTQAAETPFDWSGFYIGGNVGGNWVDYSNDGFSDSLETQMPPGPGTTLFATTSGFDSTSAAFLGGGQAGFNLQLFGHFVLGLEGDFDGTPSSATKSLFVPGPMGSGFSVDRKFESNWIASTRLRAGFAFDRFLVYGTGGGAFTDVNVRTTDSYPPTGLSVSSESQKTRVGWTAGLGAEWGVTKGISVGVEYRHSGFGRDTYGSGSFGPILTTQSSRVSTSNDQVTLRVNFLLNGLFGR